MINYDDAEWTTFERQGSQTTSGAVVSPPSAEAPSFSAPSYDAPSFSAPSPDTSDPTTAPSGASAAAHTDVDDTTSATTPESASAGSPENNPYIARYVTAELRSAWAAMTEAQLANSDEIREKYGQYGNLNIIFFVNFFYAFLSSASPHTCCSLRSTWCPC